MSRGPGNVQRTILKVLERSDAGVALPTLAWTAAAEDGFLDGDDLPEEIYKSVHRAAVGLARPRSGPPRVVVRRERVATLRELLDFYPDRTKSGTIRRLRRELLPHVGSFMYKPGLRIKDPVDTEDVILYSYGKEGPTVISRIVADWPAVEDALVSSLGRLDAGARTKAIEFLARGRRLFHTETRVTARVTLLGGIRHLRKALDGRDPELDAALVHFESRLPVRDIRRALLKAVLRTVVHLDKGDSPRMKDAFKNYLREVAPETMKSLFTEAEEGADLWARQRVEFSPILDQLVQQDALKPFDIYTLASHT